MKIDTSKSNFFLKQTFCLLVFLIFNTPGTGQSAHGEISGKITDAQTGEALPGVNISVLGTVLGASTNLDGEFSIMRVPYGIYDIRISMIGYRKVTVERVNISHDTAPLDIKLMEAPIDIDPVVVSVSKWAQEANNTASAVEVMTGKEIMKRSPIRIEDALEAAAGVQIFQENVNIRGSDGFTLGIGSRVLVMMDGVPLMTSDLGSVNWFMVSPFDLQRTEIVRGAGSAIYGSSAMGGVVNFITRDPGLESKTYVRSVVGFHDKFAQKEWDWSKKTLDYNRLDFVHSKQIDNLGMRISWSRSYSKGYQENFSHERYNLSYKFNYLFPDKSRLSFFGNYMDDNSDLFVLWDNQENASRVISTERGKRQERYGLTLFTKYSRPLSAKAAIELRAYANQFLLGIQAGDLDFSPALGLGGSLQGTYMPFEHASFIWGSDFKYDNTNSQVYGKRKAWQAAPYLQAEWNIRKKFNLTLGGRYDYYKIPKADTLSLATDSTRFVAKDRIFEHFSPKLGLNYHPFESTTLRASVSNGFKFPVIFQLFFDNQEITNITFVANDTLKSETAWSYEFGFKQTITPTWYVEGAMFYSEITDMIEPGVIGVNATFFNTRRVAIPGVEFVSNSRWFDNSLGLKVNLTYLNPHNVDTGKLLLHRQKFMAFVGASYKFKSFEFQVDYKYASRQKGYLFPGRHQFVPQKVADARFFFRWYEYTLMAGVNNLFNYAYTLRDKFLEENRNFYIGWTAEF